MPPSARFTPAQNFSTSAPQACSTRVLTSACPKADEVAIATPRAPAKATMCFIMVWLFPTAPADDMAILKAVCFA